MSAPHHLIGLRGGGPPSLEARVALLERAEAYQAERNRDLSDRDSDLAKRLGELSGEVSKLTHALETIATQRSMESKAADRWKTAAMSVAVAVALALLIWVAKIAMVVQAARATAGS